MGLDLLELNYISFDNFAITGHMITCFLETISTESI